MSLIFFLPTLYCICQRSGTIEKEKGGIETDRYVCVGRRSLRDFESFGAEGEVKEIQGERPPIGMLMPKNVADMSSTNNPSLPLSRLCFVYVMLFDYLSSSALMCRRRQETTREERGKEKALRERPLSHASFSLPNFFSAGLIFRL